MMKMSMRCSERAHGLAVDLLRASTASQETAR